MKGRRLMGRAASSIVVGGALVLSVLAGGVPRGHAMAVHRSGGTLTVAFPYQPDTMDPAVGGQTIQFQIDANILDTLVFALPSGKITPDLATSWKITNGGKTYTFTLRKGVKFQDGTPFDAQAYVAYFKRVMDPATKSTSALSGLGGPGGPFQGATAKGKYTLVLHLNKPYPPLLTNLSQPQEGVVSPTAVAKEGTGFGEHIVGTGPFMVQNWQKGSSLTLVRNPHYAWAPPALKHKGPAYLSSIVFDFVTADQARVDELQTGQAQVADSVPGIQYKALKSSGNFHVAALSLGGTGVYAFMNNSKFPTNDQAVREAILYSINRPGVLKLADAGAYPQNYGPLQRGMLGFEGTKFKSMYAYNPAKAAQILKKDGWAKVNGIWTRGGQKLTIQIISIPVEDLTDLAQAIQGYLKQAGMDATLTQLARSAWYTAWQNGDENMSTTWLSGFDPDILRSNWVGGQPFNWNKFDNPKVDAYLLKASTLTNRKVRATLYERAEDIIMAKAAEVPLRENDDLVATAKSLKGYNVTNGDMLYTNATVR